MLKNKEIITARVPVEIEESALGTKDGNCFFGIDAFYEKEELQYYTLFFSKDTNILKLLKTKNSDLIKKLYEDLKNHNFKEASDLFFEEATNQDLNIEGSSKDRNRVVERGQDDLEGVKRVNTIKKIKKNKTEGNYEVDVSERTEMLYNSKNDALSALRNLDTAIDTVKDTGEPVAKKSSLNIISAELSNKIEFTFNPRTQKILEEYSSNNAQAYDNILELIENVITSYYNITEINVTTTGIIISVDENMGKDLVYSESYIKEFLSNASIFFSSAKSRDTKYEIKHRFTLDDSVYFTDDSGEIDYGKVLTFYVGENGEINYYVETREGRMSFEENELSSEVEDARIKRDYAQQHKELNEETIQDDSLIAEDFIKQLPSFDYDTKEELIKKYVAMGKNLPKDSPEHEKVQYALKQLMAKYNVSIEKDAFVLLDDPFFRESDPNFKSLGSCKNCHTYIYPPNNLPPSEYQKYFNRQIPADLMCPGCGHFISEEGGFMYSYASNSMGVDKEHLKEDADNFDRIENKAEEILDIVDILKKDDEELK